MTLRASLLACVVLAAPAGCVGQGDINAPVQQQLAVTGRVMGFALDAQIETLELKLALVRKDPSLAASLGTEASILGKIDRVRNDQREIQEELRRLKTRYAVEEGP